MLDTTQPNLVKNIQGCHGNFLSAPVGLVQLEGIH